METSEDLLQIVKAAVRQTVAAVRAQHPRERLAGYALLTDDELVTLSYMAVTENALASGGGDDLLFCPVDWPYEYDHAAFNPASERLRAMEAASESPDHVEVAFATLVQGLAEVQAEGLFAPEVYLSVLSTDPSDYSLALERAAVERLNRKALVEARERYLERWAG